MLGIPPTYPMIALAGNLHGPISYNGARPTAYSGAATEVEPGTGTFNGSALAVSRCASLNKRASALGVLESSTASEI